VALARYNPDGTLNVSFHGDGKLVTDLQVCLFLGAYGLGTDTRGAVAAAGFCQRSAGGSRDLAVARCLPNGGPDLGFSADGWVLTDLGGSDEAFGLAVRGDGKIVVAGSSDLDGFGSPWDFTLTRYREDGRLDGSFGRGGRVLTNFGAGEVGSDDIAQAVAILSDGGVVAVGSSNADDPS
jgi:uncharacterized delta-60 repeat protein